MQRFQWLAVTVLLCAASVVNAYTPKSQEVRNMVAKGVTYLEKVKSVDMGRDCLVALALYKTGKPTSHPKIRAAFGKIGNAIGELEAKQNVHRTYDQACALIFLCELNSPSHRNSMQALATKLMEWQKQNGAWGYDHEPIGDTSQTVFAALALWEARHRQIDVPDDVFRNALNWLIRTQDPGGGFAYKGEDPEDSNGRRINQRNPYPCATAAGLGATYICANALGIEAAIGQGAKTADDEIPPALKFVAVVDSDGSRISEGDSGVNRVFLLRALTDGNRWFDRNYSIAPTNWYFAPDPWNYYYLYTLERFRSFQANAEKTKEKEGESPRWYNQGVAYLMKNQSDAGIFGGAEAENSRLAGPQVSTSLALMFLVRSTQKTIGKLVEEQLKGNQGLQGTGELRLSKTGRMATESVTKNVGDLLALIEEGGSEEDFQELISAQLDTALKGDAKTKVSRQRFQVRH